jgi:hypothetical protein
MPDRVILQMCFLTPMRNQRRLRKVLGVFHDFPAAGSRVRGRRLQ